MLLAIDSATGRVSTLKIGEGADAAKYDPDTGLVFAPSGDGTLTVAKADAAGELALVQMLKTPVRSRTMAVDPKTHRLYVASAQFAAPAPVSAGAPPARPQVVPGSFKVVVFEPASGGAK